MSIPEEILSNIKLFTKHGFEPITISGKEVIGDCPFTGKERKFYVNYTDLLFSHKSVPELKGNKYTFLYFVDKRNRENITEELYEELSKERGIPVEQLKRFKFGYYGNEYTLATPGGKNSVLNIKTFQLGGKLFSASGMDLQLFRFEELKKYKGETVYLCEGEFDTIAMDHLIRLLNLDAIAVGVPGASTFKKEWVYPFRNKKVIVLFDNDNAGENGEHQVLKNIGSIVKEISFIHWQEKYKEGYDIRDLYKEFVNQKKSPKRAFQIISNSLKPIPRKEFDSKEYKINSDIKEPKPEIDKDMSWEKLAKIIQKWMKQDNLDHIMVLCGILLSNYIDGDPVWLFLVAAPGEGKSEAMGLFHHCSEIHITSSLTPNSLISGFNGGKAGEEVSLLPKLNGKTLCIKDFSTIQGMRDNDREALFGILRDAYDGSAGKDFGNGRKEFKSRFSIFAGATPSIYEFDASFSALGERFLKFFKGEYLLHKEQKNVIRRAMGNVGSETKMREEMSSAVYSFIENIKAHMQNPDYKIPTISETTEEKIANLAMWTAKMKGTVNRDKFDRDEIVNRAYSEVGTRTGKQLKRMLLCLPMVVLKGYEDEEDYIIIKKIALDSISARREDIFRVMYLNNENEDDSLEISKIASLSRYSIVTVTRILDDLIALSIVEKLGVRRPYSYKLSKEIINIAKNAGLYEDMISRQRKSKAEFFKELKKEGKEMFIKGEE